MQLRLVTVAFDPVRGEFPPEPLAGVEGEVLSVVEHFFQSGGASGVAAGPLLRGRS